MDALDRQQFVSNCDVLCWLLGHDHNTTFADNLDKLEKYVASLGYQLTQAPEPFTEATHPAGPKGPNE